MSEGAPVTLTRRVAEGGALPTEDLLHAMLPLMRAMAGLHAIERVADLGGEAVTDMDTGSKVEDLRARGDDEDVTRFSGAQANLFRLNGALHPVIAALITEMTALNRHERATDLDGLASGSKAIATNPQASTSSARWPERISEFDKALRPAFHGMSGRCATYGVETGSYHKRDGSRLRRLRVGA